MARIIIIGAGMNGLTAAMLLAGDGNDVTVLERDAAAPPRPAAAWDGWQRRGVNQFRMLHLVLPRWRQLVEAELPQVAAALEAAGAVRYNYIDALPEVVTGGWRDGDEELEALTARRPVLEAVLAAQAEATPGVTIRRGTPVAGLTTGSPARASSSAPHVTGVATDDGEHIEADLVIDAGGRRSPLATWLAAAGAPQPYSQREDSGYVYYGRHFRSADGSLPEQVGPLLQHHSTFSTITLPADNGTWGLGIVASARDAALRAARDPEVWDRIIRACPRVTQWAAGEPIDDGVAVMAKIEDRYHRFVVHGEPVVTGLAAVGDAWACTNPSVGRGITIGMLHVLALREQLRAVPLDDPHEFALSWHDRTEKTVTPWYDATLSFDRHRLAEIHAGIDGVPYEPADPRWDLMKGLGCAASRDPDALRAFLEVVSMLATGEDVLGRPGMLDKATELGADWREAPTFGPSRVELLELLDA